MSDVPASPSTPSPDDLFRTTEPSINRDQARRQNIEDLVQQIKESADKLAADGSSRGDLKIISRTLRELRYAFKVFSPYRQRR